MREERVGRPIDERVDGESATSDRGASDIFSAPLGPPGFIKVSEIRQAVQHPFRHFLSLAVPMTAMLGPRKLPSIYDFLEADFYHFAQLAVVMALREETNTLELLARELEQRDRMGAGEVPSFIHSLKTPGNFGFGRWVGDGPAQLRTQYLGASPRAPGVVSRAGDALDWLHAIPAEPAKFKSTGKRHSEYKILNRFAELLDKDAMGTFFLFTERLPCEKCERVIAQFLDRYRKVRLSIAYLVEGAYDAENDRVKQLQALLAGSTNGHRLYRLNATQLAAGPLRGKWPYALS